MVLVERSKAATELDSVLAEAATGNSVIAVIDGNVAMGKTTLLRVLKERAAAAGFTVLSAVGDLGDHHVPYGVVGSVVDLTGILSRRGSRAADIARESAREVAGLTARGPVLITVDDIQYADGESLHCLRYLAHALRGQPLALVMTFSPSLRGEESPALRSFLQGANVRRIRADALSVDGVARMLRDVVGEAGSVCLAARYHRLTGGNPLLVRSLCEDARSERRSSGDALRRAVVHCVDRMGPLSLRIARSVAVLGDFANLATVSRLSEVDPGVARRVVQRLNSVGAFAGLRFRYRPAACALLEAMPADALDSLRFRAARVLHEAGAPVTSVADRLLAAGPRRQAWVPPVLEQAADRALADHRVERAVQYLEFAADCCADERHGYSFRVRVAALRSTLDVRSAEEAFLALKAPILAGRVHPDDALRVARARLTPLHLGDAADMIRHTVDNTGQAALGEEWQLTRLILATSYPGVLARVGVAPEPVDPSGRPRHRHGPLLLRAAQELADTLTGAVDPGAVERAERLLEEARPASFADTTAVVCALLALVYADALDTASRWCDAITLGAGEDADPGLSAGIRCFRAFVALRQGDMDTAVEQAEGVLDLLEGHGWNDSLGLLLAVLVEAHTAAGNDQAAADFLRRPIKPELFETRAGLHYLYARGRHHLAAGRTHAALADFIACGDRMVKWGIDAPALVPWRLGAAEAWLRMGQPERAAPLVEAQLARLRGTELTRTRGITLRCLAAVRTAGERPAILERALDALQRSGDRYESSRVLADLSDAHRSLGNWTKARSAAHRARRIGKNCRGAVVRPARPAPVPREQAAVPAPERRPVRAGAKELGGSGGDTFAKLSFSERRVAALAAAGYANREIAERLYITISTVEQHLTRVYRKLSIKRREELPIGFGDDAM
ncbi:helix-turn-helix transcriptional regulator [Streptomyces cinerochromogenes]|uniref:helix-turn-helix transcriptional regulator n=1 Tax=Streptomyces cinerochromogenes TaxID=66422 RepID=UPI0033A4744D